MTGAQTYEFGPYRLEGPTRRLLRAGEPVALTPMAFDLLVALIERRDRVVDKAELMTLVWHDRFVEEANLSQTVFVLRKTLGDDQKGRPFIDTIPRRGYRFAGDVVCPGGPAAVDDRTPEAAASSRSLARLIVLPLHILRPDPETDFLAFSIPDAVTGSLTGLDSLVVRSSLIASRFGGITPDLGALAAGADVDLVLLGTIVRAGDHVRVTAQLVEAPAGRIVWSHVTQAAIGDLFHLQDDLTQRILASLSTPLSARERRLVALNVTASATAYDHFLRGNELLRDSRQWVAARDLFRRAVEADPGYAPGWAQLGRVLRLLGKYVGDDPAAMADAEAALQRALAANPELTVAQNLYALVEIDRGRAELAMHRLLDRAAHGGADPETFKGLVHACRFCGLLDASLKAHQAALRLDPRAETSVIHTYWMRGEYDRVVARPHVTAVMTLMLLGRRNEALAMARTLEGGPDKRRHVVAAERAFLEGRRDDAIAALDEAEARYGDAEGLYYIACDYAFFGARARALEVFRRSVARGFFCYPAMIENRWMAPIAAEAGYAATLGDVQKRHTRAVSMFHELGGDELLTRAL